MAQPIQSMLDRHLNLKGNLSYFDISFSVKAGLSPGKEMNTVFERKSAVAFAAGAFLGCI